MNKKDLLRLSKHSFTMYQGGFGHQKFYYVGTFFKGKKNKGVRHLVVPSLEYGVHTAELFWIDIDSYSSWGKVFNPGYAWLYEDNFHFDHLYAGAKISQRGYNYYYIETYTWEDFKKYIQNITDKYKGFMDINALDTRKPAEKYLFELDGKRYG